MPAGSIWLLERFAPWWHDSCERTQESIPQRGHFRYLAMPLTVDGGIVASEGLVGHGLLFKATERLNR